MYMLDGGDPRVVADLPWRVIEQYLEFKKDGRV